LKILSARVLENRILTRSIEPGTYLGLIESCLAVFCGCGTVLGLERVQRPGKKPVEASQFVNGEPIEVGKRFG
jgi:methionyl-tRNA formyltransferase